MLEIDALSMNQDWTKQSWDLPPYKSEEFFRRVSNLEEFKLLPVYRWALENGLIDEDDEWTGKEEGVSYDPVTEVWIGDYDEVEEEE